MPSRRWLVGGLAACLTVAAPIAAQAAAGTGPDGTTATITPLFSPNALGKATSTNVTVTSANPNNQGSVPPPTTATDVYLPAGTVLNAGAFQTCSKAMLDSQGPSACPAGSKVGSGTATVGAVIGSSALTENATVTAFNGPPQNGHSVLELYAVGTTPISAQLTIEGVLSSAPAPYGYVLHFTVPPIATVPGGPNASIESFQVTVGATKGASSTRASAAVKRKSKKKKSRRKSKAKAPTAATYITEPRSCPAGGFPWKAVFTYANGEQVAATNTAPCP